MPESWRLSLLPDHDVRLETNVSIALPITAAGLVIEMTRFALDLAPFLELIDEVGLTRAASSA
jgi:hypothetical protein